MNKYNFQPSKGNFLDSTIVFNADEETIVAPSKKIDSRNKKAIVSCILATSLILAPNNNLTSENKSLFINNESSMIGFLKKYSDDIDAPISNFVREINRVVNNSKYSKGELVKEVLSFRGLCNKWDGHEALPLEIESAANAINLLDLVGENTFCKTKEFYPNPNGTISFEWNNDTGELLMLEIGNHSMSYYLELSGKEIVYHNNKSINAEEAQQISEYIKLL